MNNKLVKFIKNKGKIHESENTEENYNEGKI